MIYKGTLIWVLVFGGILNAFAATSKYDSLKTEIQVLKQQINKLEDEREKLSQDQVKLDEQVKYQNDQINSQTGMLDTAFDGMSTQITALSIALGVIGIIFSLVTVIVGVYVDRLKNQTESLKGDNEMLLEKSIAVKGEVESLSKKIIRDTKGLYKIIRDEETNHIIERLMLVPEDIHNVSEMLLSRDIDKSQFPRLREAYNRLRTNGAFVHLSGSYLSLFFQHFAGLAVFDDSIKGEMIPLFPSLIGNEFKNDIIKTASDYFSAVLTNGIAQSVTEINLFAKALSASRYKNEEEVFSAINRSLPTREDKFLMYQSLEKSAETKIFRKQFGKFLLAFKHEELTQSEANVITEIEGLN